MNDIDPQDEASAGSAPHDQDPEQQTSRSALASRLSLAVGGLVLLSAVALIALIAWPKEAPTSCETREPSAAASAGLDTSTLRIYGVCQEDGREHAYVHIVDPAVLEDPVDAVRNCTQALADDHQVVTCYAFASDPAYEAAEVSADGSAMERKCWRSWLEQTETEGARGVSSNPDYESEGCPT